MFRLPRVAAIAAPSLAAGPALAHAIGVPHLHETHALSLILGLMLIVGWVGVAALVRARRR